MHSDASLERRYLFLEHHRILEASLLLGLRVWREMLRFYRNFGRMSPHAEEFLQIYIILLPFAPKPSEMEEIPAVLQDSLFGEALHSQLLRFCRISIFE
ncbi:hypothetical protein [Paenibacillus dendritiformis]|uniref:hypothetical protein n=1 Tax=Paenibacillus dendritiformis TaxID=130049 RepID=UPI000DA89E44|nr:hypothetical protein [Paenibacillus dendritiformis]PZM64872.1 hypothetical protein DOE73_14240 [Paenibacillus dendritiformis]